jgi:hypothetical protein
MDSVSDLDDIVDSIASFNQSMTTRIVFDEWVSATEYTVAVTQIAAVSKVQGELLDSFYVKDYSVDQYITRTSEYLAQLGDGVDIWEVGNEINGEWLGAASDVTAKISGAYNKVKLQGKKTAITLYYNGSYDGGVATENNCWEKPENQMFIWAETNIPDEMKSGLDYVWVSYYEDDCDDIQPDWQQVFEDLGAMFPNSYIGIGECGTTKNNSKETYINRYYKELSVNHPRYVGGYFWWYGKQDFVPMTNPLWQTLNTAMAGQ